MFAGKWLKQYPKTSGLTETHWYLTQTPFIPKKYFSGNTPTLEFTLSLSVNDTNHCAVQLNMTKSMVSVYSFIWNRLQSKLSQHKLITLACSFQMEFISVSERGVRWLEKQSTISWVMIRSGHTTCLKINQN